MSATDTSAAAVKQTENRNGTAPVPPQNLEAEESVIGALMLVGPDSGLYDTLADTGLAAGDFYRESHATIYRTALALHNAGEPTDAIAITNALDQAGRLDDVGGRQRIHELAALVPATANARHYAEIIREMAVLRGLIRVGQEIARLGWERPDTTDALRNQAAQLVDDLNTSPDARQRLEVLTLEQFTGIEDDVADPLIGTTDDMLLPSDGFLLMYGDGGAGKTTLSIDALVHAAAGVPWLTNTIGKRARCLLVENEGPRGPFRRLLQRKRDSWQGTPFADHVHVLEEPWARYTLDDTACRRGLAAEIDRTGTDLVMIGPLASLGAAGTGTPDDVNAFANLITDLRARASRPFALWIIHHENKAGDISGAWERLPDTLLHVSAQGNGRTRLAYRKARWSSRLHDTAAMLAWADNASFELIPDKPERDLEGEIAAFLEENPRSSTREIREAIGGSPNKIGKALAEHERFAYEEGPRGAKLWHLTGDGDLYSQPEYQSIPVDQTGSVDDRYSDRSPVGGSESGIQVRPVDPAPVSHDDERARWLDDE